MFIVQVFLETEPLRRWSSKGHSLVTQKKPLHIHCSDPLGDRALMSWCEFYSKDDPKKAMHVHCSVLPGRASSQHVVLLRRWSWKGCLSVTLGKSLLCTFTVQICLPGERAFEQIVSLQRWSWKRHSSLTLSKTILNTLPCTKIVTEPMFAHGPISLVKGTDGTLIFWYSYAT